MFRFTLCAGDRGDDGFQGLQVKQSKRQNFVQLDLGNKAPKCARMMERNRFDFYLNSL